MAERSPGSCRRDEALAFIIERIVRDGSSPSGPEIARALHVSDTRAKQLIAELVERGSIDRVPGSARRLRVRDVAQARELVAMVLVRLGWVTAPPMGELSAMQPHRQIPVLPRLEHLPDI